MRSGWRGLRGWGNRRATRELAAWQLYVDVYAGMWRIVTVGEIADNETAHETARLRDQLDQRVAVLGPQGPDVARRIEDALRLVEAGTDQHEAPALLTQILDELVRLGRLFPLHQRLPAAA